MVSRVIAINITVHYVIIKFYCCFCQLLIITILFLQCLKVKDMVNIEIILTYKPYEVLQTPLLLQKP